jgi:ferredoxin-NADP reductase
MAERGARPNVPAWRVRLLRGLRALFTPLLPDDYLELINPLWSTQELRGRIMRIERETADAVTVVIKPGWAWPGHKPGQYLRIGMPVDGVHHWRAYSITSDPGRPDGCISVTPKLVESGKVSPYLVRSAQPGVIVRLGGVEGAFTLPDPLPAKLLFISAGSGVTPIMSMLRSIDSVQGLTDAVHLHSARTADDVIFGAQLRVVAQRNPGFRLHERHTGESGRISPADFDRLCPDWRERETFLSGPPEMLAAVIEHWKAQLGDCDHLHVEHFQLYLGGRRASRETAGRSAFALAT